MTAAEINVQNEYSLGEIVDGATFEDHYIPAKRFGILTSRLCRQNINRLQIIWSKSVSRQLLIYNHYLSDYSNGNKKWRLKRSEAYCSIVGHPAVHVIKYFTNLSQYQQLEPTTMISSTTIGHCLDHMIQFPVYTAFVNTNRQIAIHQARK